MFQPSALKKMRWNAFIKDIKDKVGLSPNHPSSPSSPTSLPRASSGHWPPVAAAPGSAAAIAREDEILALLAKYESESYADERGEHELELDFKRFWDFFLSSTSQKEKETTLSMAISIFCRLVKQQQSVTQLIAMLVEAHIFTFVIGRTLVADIEKFRISNSAKSLHAGKVLSFLSETIKDRIRPGSNLLFAIEVLVSVPINKQPFLDSGVLCCLVHVFNAFVNFDEINEEEFSVNSDDLVSSEETCSEGSAHAKYLELEESIVHVMKALASHPSAAFSLTEDESLKILFQIVATGSLKVFSQFKQGLVPLHVVQLHRHAMQILGLLLLNDNGSTASYIHKHHLIKVFLMAVKDFNPDFGDSAYTVGIVDLLLECVELSYRPGAGSIRLKEDIHNSHGYQFLVQFALTLSCSHDNVANQSRSSDESTCMKNPDPYSEAADKDVTESVGTSPVHVYPSLSRLLDIFASLAQTGPAEPAGFFGVTSLESTNEIWGSVNTKVQDLEAIQMLQDIFLKFDNIQVKAEVLDIMFKIFTNHVENYKLCQQLRTVPLFILNMGDFPPLLQEKILKILEYAVIVVNCIPEQELLALCCLLQQPITSYLKHAILSFFVKLLSFDNRYKKVLREVGVLEVLIDDLKQHKFISGAGNRNKNASDSGRNSTSSSFKKHIDSKDVILSTSRLMGSGSAKFPLFEDDGSIAVAWDCLLSLLKKDEANQSLFRSASGFSIALSFLVSDIHRSAALRLLSCLIIEDTIQVHSEELGFLIETLKSGIVGSLMEQEYKLVNDAKSDILGALWRILGANSSVQKIFGEATGFSLLLTTLYSFQSDGEHPSGRYSLASNMKVFSCLLRVMTAAVRGNDVNRLRLNTTISSETFFDLLRESNLISDGYEKQVIQVLLELAFEIILPPSSGLTENAWPSNVDEPDSISFMFEGSLETFMPETERVYNASAVMVLIRSLLLFTSKVQLKLLLLIEKLASASSFNQENLTSAGCVGLLLDITSPLLTESSPVLMHALRIVEVLGAYRLSTLELRLLVKYTLQMKSLNSGYYLVDMMEKLIQRQDTMSESVPLAPFVEMDMSRTGHASIQSSLGERAWPPNAGYSFVCWFQYQYFSHSKYEEHELQSEVDFIRSNTSGRHSGEQILRLFSVGAVDDSKTFYLEIYLQDTGVLTLATSSSSKLSFSGLKLEEGRWYHLAIIHSKPNAIAGLFQDGIAYIYLNGKLTHTGNLGYSPSPVGKPLQVTIGTPLACAKVGNLSWRLRCCYLFEEVLTAGGICFMYILGRGYRGIFQDADLLKFVPILSCGGDSMSILDSLDSELSAVSKLESISKDRHGRLGGSNIVWDSHRLFNLSLQLRGRKLIFAFDGASSEVLRAFGRPSMLNLVDPKCAAASPIGGIPRFGILEGDSYLCHQYVIGNCIRTVGGMTVILALVEAAETRDMLHMALTLLACALRQNPQNLNDMQYCRGYHLLAIFLHHRMSLFDMQSLDIFFQIAACEATFAEQDKFKGDQKKNSTESTSETSFEILSSRKFSEEKISSGSQGDTDVFPVRQDSFNHRSEPGTINLTAEIPKCIVLSNADMIEYVLLDWTLWVTSPVSIQLALLGFFEELVSLHWYRNHNLAFLRQINLVQHLLVALQRDDVEVQVLDKLVILLSVIFEDGFLVSELDLVARFVTMTFDPPEPSRHQQIVRETGGKHLIVRNLLLEMIIDLQLTITSDELLDQWYEILSVKFIMFFLDGYVHPTSMTWIMTLLGVCLASSPTFAHEFQSSGGYQVLTHVLPNYYDTPDIYYIVFCLIFGKSVYPRKPEISIGDFHALMPNDGLYGELKFVELQDSVIAMAKSAFDKLSMHSVLVESENLSHFGDFDVAKLADAANDHIDNLQAESPSSMASARLMSGEAAAPASATSVMRFMVDLAKMCPPFSAICRRTEFLESCVDLYFSCVRADSAVKASKHLKAGASEDSPSGTTGSQRNQHALISLIQEKAQMTSTYREHQRVPQVLTNAHSEELHRLKISPYDDNDTKIPRQFNTELDESVNKDGRADNESTEQAFVGTFGTKGFSGNSHYSNNNPEDNQLIHPTSSLTTTDLPNLTKKSDQSTVITQSPVLALTSWLASKGSSNGGKVQLASRSFTGSPASAMNVSPEPLTSSQDLSVINSKLLVEIEESGDTGGSCSAGASAILDFIAIVLSDIVSEQSKASQDVENILESSPSYVDVESVLVFQGLCLGRLMNFLERRLIRDDEKGEKKLDKNIWSVNLGALCWMIVDRVYMGAFPQPAGVLKALEFLLSMLQLANKDGGIEKAVPAGKGLLSVSRGGRQLDTYVRALLKSANRMIMYCFLPSFLVSIEEEDFLSMLGFQTEQRKSLLMQTTVQDESIINIGKVLQLIFAHKQLVLSPSNLDTDLICCLCVNLISLLRDQRRSTRNLAVEIIKYMLVHRRAAVEELLAANPYQGQNLNVLDGGFDKLLTGSSSMFFEWLHASEQNIEKVLEQCAALMWTQYIGGSAKFPGIRIKGMEGRRGKKMGKKLKDESASDLKHWEHVNEQRRILKLASNAMSTELRVVRQNKYGWVLHAESEWQNHLQQLVHERGIIPLCNSLEPEWKLCIIEGPYRMRKKLERCKLKTDMIQTFMVGSSNLKERKRVEEKDENSLITSQSNSNSASNLLSGSLTQNVIDGGEYDDSLFEADDYREESMSSRISWNDGQVSSVDGASLHSAKALAAKSPVETPYRNNSNSAMDSPEKLSYMKIGRLEMKLHDSGEYLIRPYLEHLEKIRFKYNCERVVGLDKHDGIFLIGELCLYVIGNVYIDDYGRICEKQCEDALSVIDQALGVKEDTTGSYDNQTKSSSTLGVSAKPFLRGRAWAYNGGGWDKEKVHSYSNLPHPWHMWKLGSVHEVLKRDYQLRPVAIEIFSIDGCNNLLVFHKREREEVFRNLVSIIPPRNNMLSNSMSGLSKQESNASSPPFKITAKSITKRWQNGEISNFQYLMHLNTLAGRGYNDLTQYPVFPWVLADYESENLDLTNPETFRKFDKPVGCQTIDGEEEFKNRYEAWDDPDVPQFHYGSHYSSAGIVLFYLLRLPPFSTENQKLQGGQFDRADRLFTSVRDTWLSAIAKGNTSDVKELIPEFFYMPEFLENRFNLNLGEKQSGEKVGDVILPPWAKGSAREFIRRHREALECDYVSENLHHWIDLIFGYKQRGKAAEEAVNVFYHYTYEGSVDIDSISDPAIKASILAQINHFGQTPKQLFFKPHEKRRTDIRAPPHPLCHCTDLISHEVRKSSSLISQIVFFREKILTAGKNNMLKPDTYNEYIVWGFPDCSLRFVTYDQDKILSTHESLHGGNQIQSAGVTSDGQILVTGADDGMVAAWRINKDKARGQKHLHLLRNLCAHTAKVTCLYVCQPYMLIVTGSEDCSVILWDLNSLVFVKQLMEFPEPVTAIQVNDLTGEIITAAGTLLAVWSVNGDCLAFINTSQLPSDTILSVTSSTFSDWQDTNWYVTGHQSGSIKVWNMVHFTDDSSNSNELSTNETTRLSLPGTAPEYRLVLRRVLRYHKYPVTALLLTSDLRQLLGGDSSGNLLSWTLPDEGVRTSFRTRLSM